MKAMLVVDYSVVQKALHGYAKTLSPILSKRTNLIASMRNNRVRKFWFFGTNEYDQVVRNSTKHWSINHYLYEKGKITYEEFRHLQFSDDKAFAEGYQNMSQMSIYEIAGTLAMSLSEEQACLVERYFPYGKDFVPYSEWREEDYVG